jgi:hypothetical protein
MVRTRVLRSLTSPNSAATKKPLRSTNKKAIKTNKKLLLIGLAKRLKSKLKKVIYFA